MSRSVGVLMKKEQGHSVFLTADGSFMKGRSKVIGAEVGQEVEFIPSRSRVAEWARLGLVAVLMLAVMVSGISVYLTRPVIAAYVTVDINPSLEMGIDQHQIVRRITALNPEAEALIADVNVVGMHVTDALEAVMSTAAQDGYLAPDSEHLIVIATTYVAGRQTDQDELTAELDNKARAIVAGHEQTVVTSMAAGPEIREEATKQGVSLGQLLVVQKAEEAGIHLNPQELKSSNLSQSIRAAGGDPSVILRKDNGQSAGSESQGAVNGSKNKSNGQDKDNPGKNGQGTSKTDKKQSSAESQGEQGSQSSKQDKGNDKDKSNNGRNGQAPGQSKR
ncbi:MAG: hypothetical protein ACM3ZQ_03025 [Bacillota bacterium]